MTLKLFDIHSFEAVFIVPRSKMIFLENERTYVLVFFSSRITGCTVLRYDIV